MSEVSVSLAQASQIAAARIAQLDQAIAVLDSATSAASVLVDMRSVWENVPSFVAQRPASVDPGEFVDAIRRSCFDLARKHRTDPNMQAQVVAWVEIASMLRVDYLPVRAQIRAANPPRHVTELSRILLDRPPNREEG